MQYQVVHTNEYIVHEELSPQGERFSIFIFISSIFLRSCQDSIKKILRDKILWDIWYWRTFQTNITENTYNSIVKAN